MKKNLKELLSLFLVLAMCFSLVACSSGEGRESQTDNTQTEGTENTESMEGESAEAGSFEEIIKKAEGTTVTFYGWGGDERLNEWLDTVFAPRMKEKYNITMERVPMDIDQVLSKLSGEMQAGKEDGSIDMIWINGENFYSAKENGMLYGPFLEELPNFEKYIDTESEDVLYDFAYPIEGYEAPYGKAQLVMIGDSAVVESFPTSTEELLEFCKANPGKVTYPALPDFTGSAFVRNIIYDIVGYEQFLTMEADKAVVQEAIQPAIDYLNQLEPYLWNEGQSYPATSTQLDNMYMDGEVIINMGYEAFSAATGIENGSYPETTQTFIFEKGMIGNTNFMAIAANSGNKEGAMAAINEMMSAEVQASRYDILRTLPVVDYEKLTDEEKVLFDQVDIGQGVLTQDELLAKRLPEMPANLVPIIEEIWLEQVANN